MRIDKTFEKPTTKYFLRAESFYNVASKVDRIVREGNGPGMLMTYGGKSLHQGSHGESFLQLLQNGFYEKGLYFLDEPEAALSPRRQLSLLVIIGDLVKTGSQFIIATHSPIILSYYNAEIYHFDDCIKKINYKDTEVYKLYKLFLDNSEMMLDKLLGEEK